MADISTPEINIARKQERSLFSRLIRQRDVARSQMSAEGIKAGQEVSQRVDAELARIRQSMAETPMPGVLPGSQKEFTQRINEAKVDGELTPEMPVVSEAEKEHHALVDFVSNPANHVNAPDLAAARPANVVPQPEGMPAPQIFTHQSGENGIGPGVFPTRTSLEPAHQAIAQSEAEMKFRREEIIRKNAAAKAALETNFATKPGMSEAPFSVDRNDQGEMSVNRPDTTQTSIRDRVRSRITSFMSRLPTRKR